MAALVTRNAGARALEDKPSSTEQDAETNGGAGGSGEGGTIGNREFFWDSIVLFVVSSLVGLAVLDFITEFIQQTNGLSCYLNDSAGSNNGEHRGEAISDPAVCAHSVPFSQYFPVFLFVHGVLLQVPHYLWLNHYGGSFEFFFRTAGSLDRSLDETTGQYPRKNFLALQLEIAFSTYRRNTMKLTYALKLSLQLLWALAGVGVAWGVFRDFDPVFDCQEPWASANATDLMCIYQPLSFYKLLRATQTVLLGITAPFLAFALVWCFGEHPTELGHETIASFSYQTGLRPEHYVPYYPNIHAGLRKVMLKIFTSIPCISWSRETGSHSITTDLEFLVLRLYRADSGLGYVVRDLLIMQELRYLVEDEQRRLTLHHLRHKDTFDGKDGDRPQDRSDAGLDREQLKWSFTKEEEKYGVYRDFKTLPANQLLVLPDSMRGAVLGFGALAPGNSGALEISFNCLGGYATSIARVFQWVTALNFNSNYCNRERLVDTSHFQSSMCSMECADDVLTRGGTGAENFKKHLRGIWVPPNTDQFLKTCFVVIGPMDNKTQITTVDLLLAWIARCFVKEAVVVTVQPLAIAGKDVSGTFLPYTPQGPRFAPLGRSVSSTTAVQEWPARGSLITPPPSNNQPNTATTSTSTTNTSQHCALSRPPSSPPPNPPPPPGPPMPVPVASTCGCACELGVRVCMCCGGVGKARATARARGGTVVCCLVRFGLHRYTASPAEGVPRMYQATT